MATAMAVVALLLGWLAWHKLSKPAFSQQQYDEGFQLAIRLSAVSPSPNVDFKPELYSMQRGFDDGILLFCQVFPDRGGEQLPLAGPERLKRVIARVEDSVLIDEETKDKILRILYSISQDV